jgi:histone acetyltransferase (RNA polymerase elongator complex component)
MDHTQKFEKSAKRRLNFIIQENKREHTDVHDVINTLKLLRKVGFDVPFMKTDIFGQ